MSNFSAYINYKQSQDAALVEIFPKKYRLSTKSSAFGLFKTNFDKIAWSRVVLIERMHLKYRSVKTI